MLFWLASLALSATRPLPLPALRALGRALGIAAHALAPGPRRVARDNVARVFPALRRAEREALVRRSFEVLGEFLGETVALLRPDRAFPALPVAAEARAILEAARADGRGVVFASAHLGPWERVAAALVAAGVPLVAVARESYDPRFSRLYERLRAAHGVRLVWRDRRGAAARILRALRAGEVLGVPMDLRSRVPSCPAPFLGHEALTAIGPARIALRAGAPVVVGSVAPVPADGPPSRLAGPPKPRLQVTATRIDTHDLPRDPRRAHESARELTRRINDELSRRILALPQAWVWMHERWETRRQPKAPAEGEPAAKTSV